MVVSITETGVDDVLVGTSGDDTLIGGAGDDTLQGAAGRDILIGDFADANLLSGSDSANSFAQYGETGAWTVEDLGNGHTAMSQSVQTTDDASYTVSFDAAANIGDGHLSGTIEVLWNGEVIDTINTAAAGFSSHAVELIGTSGPDQLTFRSVEVENAPEGPQIDTSGPIFSYETTVDIGGTNVTVHAVAAGQPNLYQVINGTLSVFDVQSQTYTLAGSDATVVVNGFGLNSEDGLFYGIAVKDGVDALGNAVKKTDVIMMDAHGDSYLIGSGPYASWTGDFDDQGNLWSFHSSMDRVTVIDVDQKDSNGDPVATVYKFPKDLVSDKLWDLTFDPATQKFYGVVKADHEGAATKLFIVDTAEVALGGDPSFSTFDITSVMIDGAVQMGVPLITFGAAFVDSDGTIYVGGNGGDHDMNDATGASGGIYKVVIDDALGTAQLVLLSEAPKSYSNDGASDPNSIDPFLETDPGATVLIRTPELLQTPDASGSYNDTIEAGAGADMASGGYGEDLIIGGSAGDVLNGDSGNDEIHGGAGPDHSGSTMSHYDDLGNRYDQFGNPLAEEDDIISGGDGADILSGSAGHDTLSGDAGDDVLSGGTGADVMYGGAGDDALSGGSQDDIMHGNDGQDELVGGSGDDLLHGGTGDDTLKGGSGQDEIVGDTGADVIDAGSGDDSVHGGTGNDKIKLGSGDDIAIGGDGNDYINGYIGNDVIDGGAGKDTLYMGAGSDIATGGLGSDRFVFRSEDLDGSTDIVTDFTRDGSERDRLDLRQLDLLSDNQTQEEWMAEHLALLASGDVIVSMDGLDIILQNDDQSGELFLDTVQDGLML